MSQVRVFFDVDFRGGHVVIDKDVPDLRVLGYNDVISSVLVMPEGTWTFYEHINYAGYSVTVSAYGGITGGGSYSNPSELGGRNDAFSSIRRNTELVTRANNPKIRLFRDANYLGGEVQVTGNGVTKSLVELGFNDVASSVIVEGGTWILMEHADRDGLAVTVSAHGGPKNDGRYPDPSWLGARNDVFSRVRNVSVLG